MTHKSVSELSPAQRHMLHLLNQEDAGNQACEIVLRRIQAVCAGMNEMLNTYGVGKTLYECETYETSGLESFSVLITREGYPSFDVRYIITKPFTTSDTISNVESVLEISETQDGLPKSQTASNVANGTGYRTNQASMPVEIISSLASTWGPPGGTLDNDGTYVHTMGHDFDLHLVKILFRP